MKIDINKVKVKKLYTELLDEYLKLYDNVKKHMEHPEWLGEFSRDDYIYLLNNGANIFVWTYNSKMIAAGMTIPTKQKDLDKFFIQNLNYHEVIDFGPELVDIDYVGNGLQNEIIRFLIEYAKENRYKYGVSTIHPENKYSIKNFEKNGFEYIERVELKRGIRNVYKKELRKINS
ncbi:MAG TPA: hypothetical protein OIM45_03910 [Clostridiaceae bacterium]|nr:hypothetical protein [Clostridiaceae bacterium]